TLVSEPVRRSRAGDKQVVRAKRGGADEPACGLIHCQRAQAMTKENERAIQQPPHFGKKLFDKFVDVGDWCFGDTAKPTGRFDCNHFDPWIDGLCPVAINGGTSAGEWKAKQPNTGSRSWAHNNNPAGTGAIALNHRCLRPGFVVSDLIRGDCRTTERMRSLDGN